MRIALLTWFYPPGGSGLGRAAHSIAHGLAENGCKVTVFTASLPYGSRHLLEGVEIVGCAPTAGGIGGWVRKRAGFGHLVGPWHFRKALLTEHARAKFDLVEATNWYAPASLISPGEIPLVVRNSTPAVDAASTDVSLRHRLDMATANLLERQSARRASALISNTCTHKSLIEQLYRLDGTRTHRVVGLALSPRLLRRADAAAPKNKDRPASSLFVGRDERRKGFREMLAGYAAFVQNGRSRGNAPMTLTLVGIDHATLAIALSEIAGKPDLTPHIRCHPEISDEHLYDLYDEADIVLAPSRYESYGLVYREAAAFRCSLIACAEDPAAVQFVGENRCGVLAERCSPGAIAECLDRLVDDVALRATLGANGRAHAKTLSRERLGRETLAIYRDVTGAGAPILTRLATS